MAAYELLLLNTAIPQIQAAQSGDTYLCPRELAVVVNTATDAVRITQTGTGNALLVEDSANPDSTPFVVTATGDVGIGTSSPAQTLHVKTSTAATPITLGVLSNSTTLPALSFNGAYASTTMAGTYSLTGSLYTTVPSGAAQYFSIADVIKMTLDSSGNLGLGVTPSAWYSTSGTKVFQFAASGSLFGLDVSSSDRRVTLQNNAFINSAGSEIYLNDGAATKYEQRSGQHRWSTVTSGTAGDPLSFTQAMTLDANGRLLIGLTSLGGSPATLNFADTTGLKISFNGGANNHYSISKLAGGGTLGDGEYNFTAGNTTAGTFTFSSGGSERARITSGGDLLVGKTVTTFSTVGVNILSTGSGQFTASSNEVLDINRLVSDGKLVRFFQDSTEEGDISVSGTTVSYNGGHLSRWAQTIGPKDDTLVKGTVLSNLDEMNQYVDAEGNPVPNEQLNKVKVSDVEGDVNVAGVFVNWTHDDAHNVDEINMAMTGDMIIRIAQGVTVQKGDLLMSAGDGTAKPQGDDIRRSKTIAKVTSNHVTCTHSDGSYCVPCVLMAC